MQVVFQPTRKGLRQPSAGLCFAEQNLHDRIARLLTGRPGLQKRRYLIKPRHSDRAAALKHHDGILVRLSDAVYESWL
jgi:hypothetical protein